VAGAGERTHPVNLSLFQPVSTSPDPDVGTSFRLSLIYGHVREVRGVDVGGLVARTDADSRGLRFALLTSIVGGEFRGLSATGLLDHVGGDVRGLQLSGLVSYDRGSFTGLQLSGLFNFVEETAVGIQLSSVFSLSDRAGRLFQISSVGNAVGGDLGGLQISGLNFVEGDLVGAQGGVLNFASGLRGIQVGGVNVALEAGGPQIGLVNYSESHTSIPVGLASFSDTSNSDWFLEASSLVGIATGLRTTVNGWRASAAVGGTSVTDAEARVVAFGWWWGREFPAGRRWTIAPDLGFVHLTAKEAEAGEDEKRPAGQVRVLFERRFSGRFAAYAGGGVSLEFSRYGSGADSEVTGLGVLGVSLL
jgi:hypothetical protein